MSAFYIPFFAKTKLTLSFLGLLLLLSIGLDTVQELLATLGVLDMLNTEVNTLLHITVTDLLVDNNTNRGLGDVKDDTSATINKLL
jgi:hypothetical protein